MVWGGVAMNETEERAYRYSLGQGATGKTAAEFAIWYPIYGLGSVGESWREWSRLKSLDLTDDEAVDLIREQFRRDEQ
jgi:hypothetical protein